MVTFFAESGGVRLSDPAGFRRLRYVAGRVAIWGLERVAAQMRGLDGVISPGKMRLLSDGAGCTFSRPLRAEIVEQQEQALAEGAEDLKMHRCGAR